jgi:hypothetical protein
MSIQAGSSCHIGDEQRHSRNVDCSNYAATCGNPKMLDEGMWIPMRRHDRQFAIGSSNCKGGHLTWDCLHDMMQDNLPDRRETGGIRQRSREVLRDNFKRPWRRIVLTIAQRETMCEIAKD